MAVPAKKRKLKTMVGDDPMDTSDECDSESNSRSGIPTTAAAAAAASGSLERNGRALSSSISSEIDTALSPATLTEAIGGPSAAYSERAIAGAGATPMLTLNQESSNADSRNLNDNGTSAGTGGAGDTLPLVGSPSGLEVQGNGRSGCREEGATKAAATTLTAAATTITAAATAPAAAVMTTVATTITAATAPAAAEITTHSGPVRPNFSFGDCCGGGDASSSGDASRTKLIQKGLDNERVKVTTPAATTERRTEAVITTTAEGRVEPALGMESTKKQTHVPAPTSSSAEKTTFITATTSAIASDSTDISTVSFSSNTDKPVTTSPLPAGEKVGHVLETPPPPLVVEEIRNDLQKGLSTASGTTSGDVDRVGTTVISEVPKKAVDSQGEREEGGSCLALVAKGQASIRYVLRDLTLFPKNIIFVVLLSAFFYVLSLLLQVFPL